jgi:UDP-N-acetyl-D-mannosaminuronic acid dehydrogenase
MPDYVVKRTERVLSDTGIPIEEATILILGATYRAGVEELRKSPARPITGGLDERGASVRIVDPLADVDDLASLAADPLALDRVESVDPDAVIMMTAHEEFDDIDYSAFDDAAIVDTRRVLEERATYVIGRGDGVSPKG